MGMGKGSVATDMGMELDKSQTLMVRRIRRWVKAARYERERFNLNR